jgi:hypothetical protein
MAMDSVPPSARVNMILLLLLLQLEGLTGECRGDEDRCETADSIDKGRAWDVPVLAADVVAGFIAAAVDDYSKDDEDLRVLVWNVV